MNLFDHVSAPIELEMPGAEVTYHPNFIRKEKADQLFETLLQTIVWKQDNITVFGKTYPQPRLTALYGNSNAPYTYSNITMQPLSFTKELQLLKKQIEHLVGTSFTSCLLNLYRNGQDSNGWHADNEKELGNCPLIASVSLGEERWFHFKHKTDKTLKQKLLLNHGSLLIMKGETQHNWLHQLPKTKTKDKPRINLTFRIINP